MPPGIAAEGRDWLLAALCAPLGARIVGYDRRNACGWLLLAVGVLGAIAVGTSLAAAGPAAWVRGWIWWPGYGLLVLVAALFPDGRPASRRWRPVVAGLAATVVAGTVALASLVARTPELLRGADVGHGWDRRLFLAATVALVVGGLLAVASVIARVSRSATRGPLLWAAGNAALLVAALLLEAVGNVPAAWLVGVLAVPVATVVGVVRYGLYDIDLLVHRALLHGVLTVFVVVVYCAAVTITARLLPSAAVPAAVAVCVVVLLPVGQRVRHLLDRRLYGRQPYELLTDLGRSAGAVEVDHLLATLAERLCTGLLVPYAAIRLDVAEACHGRRRPWPVTEVPIIHQGAAVGLLVVQQRAPDESWTRRDRALLADLGHQLGPIAASVRLDHELRTAHGSLLHARAEEARRLQRDLHDGLGPTLLGVRLLARAGRARASADEAARQTWDEVEQGLAGATTEVRRILSGLGPAALDRGLGAALHAVVHRHRTEELRIDLDVSADLTGLPAAVEVAAYRVVDEALANVVRHARARTATVVVTRTGGAMQIMVADDGSGGATDRPGGIGLGSLRERCRQLGGTLTIASRSPGTVLTATLLDGVDQLPELGEPPAAAPRVRIQASAVCADGCGRNSSGPPARE